MRFDSLIFDLDGTLADTAEDLVVSVTGAMRAQKLEPPARERIVAAIGGGVSKLIERLVAEPARRLGVLASFMAHYDAQLLNHTRLYPGVAETLKALAAIPMAVLTNKPEGFSRRILEGLKIAGRFKVVVGGDSMPVRKPDPAVVKRALEVLGGQRPLLVGDSGVDVETALLSGIPCCAVTYGYHKPGDLDAADFRIDSILELLPLVRGG